MITGGKTICDNRFVFTKIFPDGRVFYQNKRVSKEMEKYKKAYNYGFDKGILSTLLSEGLTYKEASARLKEILNERK